MYVSILSTTYLHTTNIWLILVEFAIWQPKILFEMGAILQVYSVAVYAHCTNKYNFRFQISQKWKNKKKKKKNSDFPKMEKQEEEEEEEEHHFCQKYLVQYYIISKM